MDRRTDWTHCVMVGFRVSPYLPPPPPPPPIQVILPKEQGGGGLGLRELGVWRGNPLASLARPLTPSCTVEAPHTHWLPSPDP